MKNAPVRRETELEAIARRRDQIPNPKVMYLLMNRHGRARSPYYPSDVLVPGEPKYIKRPCI